jgi:hypothetical protein
MDIDNLANENETSIEVPQVNDNTAQEAYRAFLKQEKENRAKAVLNRYISGRKVMKGKKAGRKTRW